MSPSHGPSPVPPADVVVFGGTGDLAVRKLLPATIRVIEPDGSDRERRYWSPPYVRDAAKASWSPEQWEEAVLDALRLAVKRRMVSDVEVGVLLSGGVDSSLVVGLLAEQGREASSVKRTLMTRGLIGRDKAALNAKDSAERIANHRSRGGVIGTPNEIVDQLGQYAEAGIQGVQLQWLDLDDLSGLELFASDVLPQLR